jgi:thymidylate synthase (FAD)
MRTAIHADVFHTPAGTPYLRQPGAVLISRPQVDLSGLGPFLEAFTRDGVDFSSYLEDPVVLADADQLAKLAGQACYMSFGQHRSWNERAADYFRNILASGHGSVLEHANFTIVTYGGDRSYTHEAVRHRAGFAYSQESQRYVDGKVLRFVERIEFQADAELHGLFEKRIDRAAAEYDDLAERLRASYLASRPGFVDLPRTEQRKAVNQAARACLPNETEAVIVTTGNVRAWRNTIELRASPHADRPIRAIAFRQLLLLREAAPLLFADYRLDHENETAESEFRKV